jgi:hypothetical protein
MKGVEIDKIFPQNHLICDPKNSNFLQLNQFQFLCFLEYIRIFTKNCGVGVEFIKLLI